MKNKTLKNSKWLKVSQLKVGQRIAVPKEEVFDRSSPEIDYPVADIAESVERQGTMPKAEGVKDNTTSVLGRQTKKPRYNKRANRSQPLSEPHAEPFVRDYQLI